MGSCIHNQMNVADYFAKFVPIIILYFKQHSRQQFPFSVIMSNNSSLASHSGIVLKRATRATCQQRCTLPVKLMRLHVTQIKKLLRHRCFLTKFLQF